ncbi:uncharacterized protein si:ch211-151h10.2 isoform X2 [Engraulis encrasicolus]|uniref:uncharacterized protein si:ch211-151h10.2 isoform X2 n=1 Tax=Engraulis encrasicolus TaxID=184585 RepID=UPI002FD6F71C
MPQLGIVHGSLGQQQHWANEVARDRVKYHHRMDTEEQHRRRDDGGAMAVTVTGGFNRPVWWCLVPAAILWLVVQEEAPLYLSLGLPEVGARLLLLSALCLGAALGVLAVKFNNHHHSEKPPQVEEPQVQEKASSFVHSERVMALHSPRITQTPTCIRPRGGSEEPAVPLAQTLTDCLVLSLLHEPQHTSTTFSVLPLISRLEAIMALSNALQRADIPQTPQDNNGQEENKTDAVGERIKGINIYLEERAEALRRLQRVQAEFGACVREAEAQLSSHWSQLEELHVRVTLSPAHTHTGDTHTLPDSSQVLRDTQCLVSDLEQSKARVHQCQTHLAANSKILKELDHSWLELSRTVNSELLYSSWTSDLLRANSDKFDEVLQSLTSLEQQASTFDTHLKGLEKAVALDCHSLHNNNSSTSNVEKANGTTQHINGPVQEAIVESPVAEEKTSRHSLKLKSGLLRGLRKKRK